MLTALAVEAACFAATSTRPERTRSHGAERPCALDAFEVVKFTF